MRNNNIELLMHEANIELDKFTTGEYRVLRSDEESAGRLSLAEMNVYTPKMSQDDGLNRFREVFWNNGHYADNSIGTVMRDIVCLCKVVSIKKAVYFNGKWEYPHLIVENVATHQSFDFAMIIEGSYRITKNSISHEGKTYDSLIMPYLLKTYDDLEKHPIRVFSKYKTYIKHCPVFVGVELETASYAEIAAHLKHIAIIKKKEIKQQQQIELRNKQEEFITQNMINELYKELDF